MSALFSRRANAVARISLLVLAVLVIGVPVVLMLWVRTSFATGAHADVVQPVPFDHRVHARGLRIDCAFCHATVRVAAPAGLPPTEACVGCHAPGLVASAPFAPVRASLASGRPIAWRRVTGLPDFVFFDHSIHVAKGVGCETCHGRVDEMARISQAASLSMGWCVGCHRDPAPHLRPRAEITTMGWDQTHRGAARVAAGERLMRDYHVRRLTTCTTCHR